MRRLELNNLLFEVKYLYSLSVGVLLLLRHESHLVIILLLNLNELQSELLALGFVLVDDV